ncbi:uncharacterized protein BXZ73DRAFT_41313 [Epithele typhae]|uniref:uncharacterized protein n=1 Tax=Epithele typhae TaxID=378194 RepID=UPI002007525D|nr:uncharacterized protein BXZ73DRAFT_41313 [Epithele typhae]KAH9942304.1 hypothetical protein BXZ73DRAFT_41313 [Epithele typhae]
MADSPAQSESANESGDDGQLTIRIPNPKVFMARQSQWKGRRGKPRCDHCRLNNLKCDRVLPTCNHCSWAAGRECKYTPLPTPAHRGIPRCDRCRLNNLKCDRNLPICNHCTENGQPDCNYTPKKRHKVPNDNGAIGARPVMPYASKTAAFLVNDHQDEEMPLDNAVPGPSAGPSYDLKNLAEPRIRQYMPPDRSTSGGTPAEDDSMDIDQDRPYQHRAPDGTFSWPEQGMIVTTPHVDPWMHPHFVPLPDVVLRGLRNVNAIEMPSRHHFEDALQKFLQGLTPELRDTATFPLEIYADMATAVASGRANELPPRLQLWTACHHARAGSAKRHLLLLPRDAFYHMARADEEKLRRNYVAQADGEDRSETALRHAAEAGLSPAQATAVFERVPVQNQIFDVLVYTHRNHGASNTMLFESRRIGVATITWPMVEMFIRLCPLCKLRARGGRTPPAEEQPLPQAQVQQPQPQPPSVSAPVAIYRPSAPPVLIPTSASVAILKR